MFGASTKSLAPKFEDVLEPEKSKNQDIESILSTQSIVLVEKIQIFLKKKQIPQKNI